MICKKIIMLIIIGMFLSTSVATSITVDSNTIDEIIENKMNTLSEKDDFDEFDILSNFYNMGKPGFGLTQLSNDRDGEKYGQGFKITSSLQNNATITGYVKDENTNDSIENAQIIAFWYGTHSNICWDTCHTDLTGFYSIDIDVEYMFLFIRANGYFTQFEQILNIEENTVLWKNASLMPGAPPQNSIVCCRVTDEKTGESIEDATVQLSWKDFEHHHFDINITRTTCSGFCSFNVASGEIYIGAYADDYYPKYGGGFIVDECDVLFVNISMGRHKPENSVICGYVNNTETGSSIENACIRVEWRDNQSHYWYNLTETNSEGFYEINIAEGEIQGIIVYAEGYYSHSLWFMDPWGYPFLSEHYYIGNNETHWMNFSLEPRPPENSVVCGYIKNSETGIPIENANIQLAWNNSRGHYESNSTETNSEGFYEMNVANGTIRIRVYETMAEYFSNRSDYLNIGENETLWVNISLDPYPPENSIVCGYVTDETTGMPIHNADVRVCWEDEEHIIIITPASI